VAKRNAAFRLPCDEDMDENYPFYEVSARA